MGRSHHHKEEWGGWATCPFPVLCCLGVHVPRLRTCSGSSSKWGAQLGLQILEPPPTIGLAGIVGICLAAAGRHASLSNDPGQGAPRQWRLGVAREMDHQAAWNPLASNGAAEWAEQYASQFSHLMSARFFPPGAPYALTATLRVQDQVHFHDTS